MDPRASEGARAGVKGMERSPAAFRSYARALLVLGRASNLPTVWSNCLAGWLLGGNGRWGDLLLLCVAASCLYTGGMYLNDAFDADFDRQHRKERPIPSGAISLAEVWGYGIGWIALGAVLMFFFGIAASVLTLWLIFFILLYDAVHKAIAFSPVLMAMCRFFLFLAAASTGAAGITGLALWSAIVLACYIVGLSYVAKSESTRGALKYWPCLLMAAPLVLAYIVNPGEYRTRGLILMAILAVWVVRSLRFTFWSGQKNVGRTVSLLLAGIVLVDLLAIAGGTPLLGIVFLCLFGLALLFQRYIPAT